MRSLPAQLRVCIAGQYGSGLADTERPSLHFALPFHLWATRATRPRRAKGGLHVPIALLASSLRGPPAAPASHMRHGTGMGKDERCAWHWGCHPTSIASAPCLAPTVRQHMGARRDRKPRDSGSRRFKTGLNQHAVTQLAHHAYGYPSGSDSGKAANSGRRNSAAARSGPRVPRKGLKGRWPSRNSRATAAEQRRAALPRPATPGRPYSDIEEGVRASCKSATEIADPGPASSARPPAPQGKMRGFVEPGGRHSRLRRTARVVASSIRDGPSIGAPGRATSRYATHALGGDEGVWGHETLQDEAGRTGTLPTPRRSGRYSRLPEPCVRVTVRPTNPPAARPRVISRSIRRRHSIPPRPNLAGVRGGISACAPVDFDDC